jgi:hypothetical protein
MGEGVSTGQASARFQDIPPRPEHATCKSNPIPSPGSQMQPVTLLTDYDSKMGYRFPRINYLVSMLMKTAEGPPPHGHNSAIDLNFLAMITMSHSRRFGVL